MLIQEECLRKCSNKWDEGKNHFIVLDKVNKTFE